MGSPTSILRLSKEGDLFYVLVCCGRTTEPIAVGENPALCVAFMYDLEGRSRAQG